MRLLHVFFILLYATTARGDNTQFPFGRETLNIPKQPQEAVVVPRTVELLSQQWSREPTEAARADLVSGLGKTASAGAVPAITAALKHPDAMVRAQAAQSAGLLKNPSMADFLRQAMNDASPLVRREVLLAGKACGTNELVKQGLQDADDSVFLAAVSTAAVSDAPLLLASLPDDPPRRQCWVITRLMEFNVPIDPAFLLSLSQGSRPSFVRIAAIDALASQKVQPDDASLAELSRSREIDLRLASARWILHAGTPAQKRSAATALLEESDARLRIAGLRIIQSAPTAELLPMIRAQMETGGASIRRAAADATVAIARENMVDVTEVASGWLGHANLAMRIEASRILGDLKSEVAIDRHVAILSDSEKRVVEVAIASLAKIGTPPAANGIVALLGSVVADSVQLRSSSDPMPARIAQAALLAVGEMQAKAAVPSCRAIISQKATAPASVRATAIWAFGVLGDGNSDEDRESIASISAFAADSLEDETVRFESVKALGNLKASTAEPLLRSMCESKQNYLLAWMACQSLYRITGQEIAFHPWTLRLTPPLDLQALSDIDKADSGSIQINAVLAAGGGYLADRWCSIRCTVENKTSQPLDGQIKLTPTEAISLPRTSAEIQVPAQSRREVTIHAILPESLSAAELAARGSGRSAALVELVSSSGAAVARASVEAQALKLTDLDEASPENARMMLYLGDDETTRDADPYSLASEVGKILGHPLVALPIGPESLPREVIAYDGVGLVVLEHIDPDELLQSQRAVLLQYVRDGGSLVLVPSERNTRSWLTGILPLEGERTSDAFVATAPGLNGISSEVDPGDDAPALQPFRVGRGMIVMCEHRLTTPQDGAQRTPLGSILRSAHDNVLPDFSTAQKQAMADVLPAMIGTPVLSWQLAAGTITGYVLLSVCLLSAVRTPWRPKAFAIVTAVAFAVSVSIALAAGLQKSSTQVAMAQVRVLNYTSTGELGSLDELTAVTGPDGKSFDVEPPLGTNFRTIAPDQSRSPLIQMRPLRLSEVHANGGNIECVYHARAHPTDSTSCLAVARFTSNGVQLTVQNNTGEMIASPLLVTGSRASRLRDMVPGESNDAIHSRNAFNDFTNPGLITSEQAKLRGEIVRAIAKTARGDRHDPQWTIIGWLQSTVLQLTHLKGVSVDIQKRVTAIRIPLTIVPPRSGETFKIDEVFTRVVFPAGGGLVAADGDGWISTAQTGDWLIRIDPPRQLGVISPLSIKVSIDCFAPAQTMEWCRGLCVNGVLEETRPGESCAQWKAIDGAKEFQFECAPADYDKEGRVYLRLRVQSDSTSAMAWRVRDISAELKATIAENPSSTTSSASE